MKTGRGPVLTHLHYYLSSSQPCEVVTLLINGGAQIHTEAARAWVPPPSATPLPCLKVVIIINRTTRAMHSSFYTLSFVSFPVASALSLPLSPALNPAKLSPSREPCHRCSPSRMPRPGCLADSLFFRSQFKCYLICLENPSSHTCPCDLLLGLRSYRPLLFRSFFRLHRSSHHTVIILSCHCVSMSVFLKGRIRTLTFPLMHSHGQNCLEHQ